jgi:hypothetical protein
MAQEKKQSKGPKDRNSNYQLKNGNAISKKKEKKTNAGKPEDAKSMLKAKSGGQKSFMSGISSSISSATSSIAKMLKH